MKQVIHTTSADEKPANALIGILRAIVGGLIGVALCTLMITVRIYVAQVFLSTACIVLFAMFGCVRKNAPVTIVEIFALIPIAIFFPIAALISAILISVATTVPITSENIIPIIKLVLNSLADPSMVTDYIELYLGWGLGIVFSIVLACKRLKRKATIHINYGQHNHPDLEKMFKDFFAQNEKARASDTESEEINTNNDKSAEMVYKSSNLFMLLKFMVPVIIAGLLVFVGLGTRDGSLKDNLLIIIIAIVPTVLSAYYNCFRNNIKIEVTRTGIKFSRLGKEYLYFPHDSFNFTSFVSKTTINGIIPAPTSRYLRVAPKGGWKAKDYLCYNFDKKTFEDLIHCIQTREYARNKTAWNQAREPQPQYPGEEAEFVINKRLLAKKYMKYLLILLVALSIFAFWPTNTDTISYPELEREVAISTKFLVLSVLFAILLVAFIVLMLKIIKQTPKKIVLCHDCLMIDLKTFNFSEIEQIKMTPPSFYSNIAGALFPPFRKLAITRQGLTHTFIVGSTAFSALGKDNIFDGYKKLCDSLEAVFINVPDKFKLDLG